MSVKYLYHCTDCGHEFEHPFAMDEPKTPQPCPKCGKEARRQFTPAADIWKDKHGKNCRSPGREWVGGDQFDPHAFEAQNDANSRRPQRNTVRHDEKRSSKS